MNANQTSSSAQSWLYFFVSAVLTILLLIFQPAWFWVPLPFVLTYLVKAFDSM